MVEGMGIVSIIPPKKFRWKFFLTEFMIRNTEFRRNSVKIPYRRNTEFRNTEFHIPRNSVKNTDFRIPRNSEKNAKFRVHIHWGSCHLVDRAAAADGQRGWNSEKNTEFRYNTEFRKNTKFRILRNSAKMRNSLK